MDDDGSMDGPFSRFVLFIFWIRIFSFFQSLHSKYRHILFYFVVQILVETEDERIRSDGAYAVIGWTKKGRCSELCAGTKNVWRICSNFISLYFCVVT